MRKSLILTSIAMAIVLCFSSEASGQRRARPGAMKHSEQEVANAMKITKVKAKYIHDGATFVGDIYLTGEAGAIKVGTATIVFSNGKYNLSFTNEKFNVKETTPSGRTRWRKQKIGEDFSYGGEYEVVEQYGDACLMLYETTAANGDCDKIPLSSKDAREFEFMQDDMLVRMHYRGY